MEHSRARVNIRVQLDKNGQRVQQELPFKVLVLGQFAEAERQLPVAELKRVAVNHANFESVLAEYAPSLTLTLADQIKKGSQAYRQSFQFSSIHDFSPDRVAMQMPACRRVIAMRNLLRDLQGHLLDAPELQTRLKQLLSDKRAVKQFQASLMQLPQHTVK